MSDTEVHIPVEINLHQHSRMLEIAFEDGRFELPCELLRVYSPAAEVRSLRAQGQFETGKESVNITAIDPVGSYAVRLVFDDGHDTGVYSWNSLHELGKNQGSLWNEYVNVLKEMGYDRNSD